VATYKPFESISQSLESVMAPLVRVVAASREVEKHLSVHHILLPGVEANTQRFFSAHDRHSCGSRSVFAGCHLAVSECLLVSCSS
jgi:hypothetical protein